MNHKPLDVVAACVFAFVSVLCITKVRFVNAQSIRNIGFDSNQVYTSQGIVLGSFDQIRGENLSFESGQHFAQARASLASRYPEIALTSFRELTSTTVSAVDILFLSTATSNVTTGSALSDAEQAVLSEFIRNGGCAILLPDNDTYGVNADAVNESLIDEFEMDITGTLFGRVTATVTDTSRSLVTNGPFGVIASFAQNYPGGITNTGQHGIALASNGLGSALVVIPRGAIGLGSGPIIIFSDINTFMDNADQGFFSENEPLFLNVIFSCLADELVFLPIIMR